MKRNKSIIDLKIIEVKHLIDFVIFVLVLGFSAQFFITNKTVSVSDYIKYVVEYPVFLCGFIAYIFLSIIIDGQCEKK